MVIVLRNAYSDLLEFAAKELVLKARNDQIDPTVSSK